MSEPSSSQPVKRALTSAVRIQISTSIAGVMSMKTAPPEANLKTLPPRFQPVRVPPNHDFHWSRGTATCACGWWKLSGASLESARRSHAIHRHNRAYAKPVGHTADNV